MDLILSTMGADFNCFFLRQKLFIHVLISDRREVFLILDITRYAEPCYEFEWHFPFLISNNRWIELFVSEF